MDIFSRIGVFDSGMGGVSVLHTLKRLFPLESFLYVGDSLYAPYGTRSPEAVYERSREICDAFVAEGVKAIVIACNTATSAAVERLRTRYDIPVIGMEPAVKPALEHTDGRIYVLATEMTLREVKYQQLLRRNDPLERVVNVPAPEWVTCVETHFEERERVTEAVRSKLSRELPAAQAIVLGCTHFIFLKPYIQDFYGGRIHLFDGNAGTATHMGNVLRINGMLLTPEHRKSPGTLEFRNTHSGAYAERERRLFEQLQSAEGECHDRSNEERNG